MASRPRSIQVLSQSHVSPPQGSVPDTSLPLTFFDAPWFLCIPIQRLFFYEFPHSTHHFTQTVLPSLKSSLSHTLQIFYPFAANLICPLRPKNPTSYFPTTIPSLSPSPSLPPIWIEPLAIIMLEMSKISTRSSRSYRPHV